MQRVVQRLLVVALTLLLPSAALANLRPPLVLAAASLQESLNAAADAWARKGRKRPTLSFAGSPALARQIEAGAQADLFISADEPWMEAVAARKLIAPRSRAVLVRNQLALVTPAAKPLRLRITPHFPLARALGNGRLAMADPDAVPAGRYGKAALQRLGVWNGVRAKVVRAENVRAALAFVERGEAAAGIVYTTDARASGKVRVAGIFPANSHPPIRYLIARLTTASSPDAEPFRRFLLSAEGRAIFRRFGFSAP